MASSIIPHERKLKCKIVSASGEVTSSGGFANIDFDFGLSTNQTLVGAFIKKVAASNTVNGVTMLQMIDNYRARAVSSIAQTITVSLGVLYME